MHTWNARNEPPINYPVAELAKTQRITDSRSPRYAK